MAAKKEYLEKNMKKIGSLLGLSHTENVSWEDIEQAVLELKSERDHYYMAIDNCVDSLNITDENGYIIFVNKMFEKKTKVSRNDVLGKNVSEMERLGFYKPSAPRLALKENRQVTIIQSGVGGDALVTAVPVRGDDGNISICVSNARFLDELTMLHNYYHEVERKQKRNEKKEIISNDERITELYDFAKQVAKADSSILITGETGTGKSMIAKYIHDHSPRARQKFLELNCASIPENLIESELFGYETGAFTGAKKGGKPGLFELADQGTLFLDEIGDMPLNLQVKLLSVIQNRKITRIGGTVEKSVDVRLITATNRNLEKMIKEEAFREDLYYRINVVPLYMPALRERKKDISYFIKIFLEYFNKKYNKSICIEDSVVNVLLQYRWPGNIRELENLIERFVVTAKKNRIGCDDLPNNIKFAVSGSNEAVKVNRLIPLKEALEKTERQLVQMAFKGNNSTYQAAKLLGISQSGASRKYLKYFGEPEK